MNKDSSNYLFVYGTLRKEADHDMHRVLEENAEYLGRGRMRGSLYNLGQYPGAISSDKVNSFVKGEVYRINHPQKTFKVLDEYEDYQPHSVNNEFKRIKIFVETNLGKRLKAWTYVYAKPVEKLKKIPSGDFIQNHKNR